MAPNGATAQGTAWLDRPGRMRFQYDPPSPLLLVAGHGLVVFMMRRWIRRPTSRSGPRRCGILLADHVVLSGDVTATGMRRLPGQIGLTLVRTAHSDRGQPDAGVHR